jgi:hypothetical protein
MLSAEAKVIRIASMTSRTGKAILCVQINTALRHAAAKHDPNAEQRRNCS